MFKLFSRVVGISVTGVFISFIAVLLLSARPAVAKDTCATTAKALDITGGLISGGALLSKLVVKELEAVQKGMHETLEADVRAAVNEKTTAGLGKTAREVAEITKPSSSLSSTFENLSKVLEVSEKNVINPLHKSYSHIVKDMELKKNYDLVSDSVKAWKQTGTSLTVAGVIVVALERILLNDCVLVEKSSLPSNFHHAEYPFIKSGDAGLVPAVYRSVTPLEWVDVAISKVNPSKSKKCKTDMQKLVDETASYISVINPKLISANKAMKKLNSILKNDIKPAMRPLLAVNKPVNEIYEHMLAIHKALKTFEHLERHVIKLRVLGVTIFHTSVHRMLKNWHKTVKNFEKVIHIKEIKKAMNHKLKKIMKPVTHEINKSVKHLTRDVSLHGFKLAKAKKAIASMKKSIAGLTDFPDVQSGFKTRHHRMQTLANSCEA